MNDPRPDEYAELDSTALAATLRAGEASPAEVESAARESLTRAHTELNALTRPLFEPALSHDPHGPLAGVPFVIKDSGPVARGVPFTLGSRALRGASAAVDQEVMARFRKAGLVTLGRSTAPELGLSFATESVLYGPTRNPWDPGLGVGGSSGGSPALVSGGSCAPHRGFAYGAWRVPPYLLWRVSGSTPTPSADSTPCRADLRFRKGTRTHRRGLRGTRAHQRSRSRTRPRTGPHRL